MSFQRLGGVLAVISCVSAVTALYFFMSSNNLSNENLSNEMTMQATHDFLEIKKNGPFLASGGTVTYEAIGERFPTRVYLLTFSLLDDKLRDWSEREISPQDHFPYPLVDIRDAIKEE